MPLKPVETQCLNASFARIISSINMKVLRGHRMALKEYRRKRDFKSTPEPGGSGKTRTRGRGLLYVIQKHIASHLHYDFRLEWQGVLLSWAIPKGPSLDPSIKRLAMQVEDHPIDYADFEGVIPPGQYGSGTVMVWDRGTWHSEIEDVESSIRKGDIKFVLQGEKLRGSWVLVRTRGFGSSSDRSTWLLIKHRDRYASKKDIVQEEPRSVASGRLMADIARDDSGDIEKATKADLTPGAAKANSRKSPGSFSRKRPTKTR
jgi:bifunctional non-homologous end joining protein LigD